MALASMSRAGGSLRSSPSSVMIISHEAKKSAGKSKKGIRVFITEGFISAKLPNKRLEGVKERW
jgi:hypothetical protein